MRAIETGARLTLKNIVLLTDFSEPSEIAIPFAIAIAREYESNVYAMHVLTPVPLAYASPESAAADIEGFEEGAQAGMQIVDAQLVGVPHETMLVRGESVWPPVEKALGEWAIDLVVLGTQAKFESALRVLRAGRTLSSLGVYSGKLAVPLEAFAAGLGDHRIITTLCPGGKERMRRLMELVRHGRLDLRPLLTHTFPLDRITEAYELFGQRRDGVV